MCSLERRWVRVGTLTQVPRSCRCNNYWNVVRARGDPIRQCCGFPLPPPTDLICCARPQFVLLYDGVRYAAVDENEIVPLSANPRCPPWASCLSGCSAVDVGDRTACDPLVTGDQIYVPSATPSCNPLYMVQLFNDNRRLFGGRSLHGSLAPVRPLRGQRDVYKGGILNTFFVRRF